MKRIIKIISVLLAFITVVMSIQITAFADSTKESIESPDNNSTKENANDAIGNLTMILSASYTDSGESVFYNKQSYGYKANGSNTTGLVSSFTNAIGKTAASTTSTVYNFTYDKNGNITQITNSAGAVQYKYTYDDLGQLTREDNAPLGYSYVYEYDNSGNITAKKRYAYTTGTLGTVQITQTYTYDSTWGDKLTGFNGTSITYDNIGNPTYMSEGDGEYTYELSWNGRELATYRYCMDYGDLEEYYISYTYNDEGIRTSKTVNGVEHEYVLSGSLIVAEKWMAGTKEFLIEYLYDESNSPIGLRYRNSDYDYDTYDSFFFEKNYFGDIVAIYNEAGTKIGTYTYDAWGNFTVATTSGITVIENTVVRYYNPFRYRGYFYDVETGWYYLQSRYYNPAWGRFITNDQIDVILATPNQLTDKNLYAYCDNNPVMRADGDGEFWHIIVGTLVGAVVGAAVSAITQIATEGEINWAKVGVSAAAGALSGLLASTGAGALVQIASNTVISGVESFLNAGISDGFDNIDYEQVVKDAAIGGLLGAKNGLSKGTAKHLMTQGLMSVKQIGKKSLTKNAKYYFSQTASLFYKPLFKDSLSSIGKSSTMNIIGHYATKAYERYIYA